MNSLSNPLHTSKPLRLHTLPPPNWLPLLQLLTISPTLSRLFRHVTPLINLPQPEPRLRRVPPRELGHAVEEDFCAVSRRGGLRFGVGGQGKEGSGEADYGGGVVGRLEEGPFKVCDCFGVVAAVEMQMAELHC